MIEHSPSDAEEVRLAPVARSGLLALVCTLYEGMAARYHRSGAVNLASVVLFDDARGEGRGGPAPDDELETAAAEEEERVAEVDQEADQEANEAADEALQAAARALGLID